jgi:hypothetical protein
VKRKAFSLLSIIAPRQEFAVLVTSSPGGWISRLESHAKPYLLELINERRTLRGFRAGWCIPHPRHWLALARLVGVSGRNEYLEPHIIRGRPFGVRFECLAQTSPERSTGG